MYTNPRGGNVFEPSVLEEIFRFEQSIYNFPGFVNYCFGFAGVRCLPIDSLVSHFFTSSGSLKTTDTETITRSFLGNQPALWKLDQFFGPDNLGSNVTRSFVFLRNVGGDQSAARPFLERFYRDFLVSHLRLLFVSAHSIFLDFPNFTVSNSWSKLLSFPSLPFSSGRTRDDTIIWYTLGIITTCKTWRDRTH